MRHNKISAAVWIAHVSALLVFLASWVYVGIGIFGRGADPDVLLPAAIVMAVSFAVAVGCSLYRVYVKFDRKYRSENKSNPTEETK